jgi:putative phosphoribosyl transferase
VIERFQVQENLHRFKNRSEAGKLLSSRLERYKGRQDVRVLALPRGGVPVAFEIAQALHATLDVFLVRKLGVPGCEELAMGAVASGRVRLLQGDVLDAFHVSPSTIEAVTETELRELQRREQLYRGSRSAPAIRDHTVILVDDGLATGSTMRVAAAAMNRQRPKYLIAAVPVAAPEACSKLKAEVDEVICAEMPQTFSSVGRWYEDFSEVSDDEVREFLAKVDQNTRVNSF